MAFRPLRLLWSARLKVDRHGTILPAHPFFLMMARKRSRIWVWFSVVLVVGLGVVATAAWFLNGSSTLVSADALIVVKRQDLALAVVATGSVVPITRVELKSKASGLVKRILAEEGAPVEQGQVLLELDRELLQAQTREAQANLRAAEARLEEAGAEAATARTAKEKMGSDLRNLESDLAFREKQMDRYRRMTEEEIVAVSELDRIERERQDAYLKLEALRSELLMQDARILAADKRVARVDAEVSQAQANLDRAEENLRYATIISPIDGVVLKRHVEPGDAVSSILQLGSQATWLMTLGDMSQLFVDGRVDESDIGKVYENQRARVRVDAFREQTFPGRVVRIAPLGEERDNVIGFEVRVGIEDPQQILRAGMSANAEIIVDEKHDILIIPESAIFYDRERKAYVDLYDPAAETGRRRVPIRIGASDGTSTEVVEGLDEGDQVVPQQVNKLI